METDGQSNYSARALQLFISIASSHQCRARITLALQPTRTRARCCIKQNQTFRGDFSKKREVYGFLARLTFSLLVFQMSRRLSQLLGLVV